MTTVAVIPVKQLENVKQRLDPVLDTGQRQRLLRAMFEDVLEVVTSCERVDRVIVVTCDARVAEVGREFGTEIRPEPEPGGLIEAVTAMGEQLAAEGVTTMVFLPADIPLITVEELEVALDGFGVMADHELLIVPARDLGGSNCVVCSPPDCMTFAFGEDSFRKHLALAREQGIEPAVARLPGIGLDIDTPADLRDYLRQAEGLTTRTARMLEEESITTKEAREAC